MGALALGIERRTAAEFSFFLAVPTMLGATVFELVKNHEAMTAPGGVGVGAIAIGFVTSFAVALVVIKAFVAVISRSGFAPFAMVSNFGRMLRLGLAFDQIGPKRDELRRARR